MGKQKGNYTNVVTRSRTRILRTDCHGVSWILSHDTTILVMLYHGYYLVDTISWILLNGYSLVDTMISRGNYLVETIPLMPSRGYYITAIIPWIRSQWNYLVDVISRMLSRVCYLVDNIVPRHTWAPSCRAPDAGWPTCTGCGRVTPVSGSSDASRPDPCKVQTFLLRNSQVTISREKQANVIN